MSSCVAKAAPTPDKHMQRTVRCAARPEPNPWIAVDTSVVQSAKLAVISALGLSRDALHISVGLGVFLFVVVVFRKPLHSAFPILAVALVAIAGEAVDAMDDLASFGYWRWAASAHDFLVTVFWPSALALLARLGLVGRGPRDAI